MACDVVALKRGRCRQDDVGPPRGRGQHRILHDDCFRPCPGLLKAVQILMVMEGIAASPIDQPDIRVGAGLAAIGVGLAWLQQQVAYPRHRNEAVDGLDALAHRRRPSDPDIGADSAKRTVSIADAAARQTDLTDQRCKAEGSPVWLLSVVGTLERPAQRHETAGFGELPRQLTDPIGGKSGDGSRPRGGLGLSVAFSFEIGKQLLGSACVCLQEGAVVAVLGHDLARKAKEKGSVGVGLDRPPFGADPVGNVVTHGRNVDNPHALVAHAREVFGKRVDGDAPGFVLGGAGAQGAEDEQCLGMVDQRVERARLAAARILVAKRVAQDDGACRDRIGIDVAGIAADKIQHAFQKGGCVMEAPGACPSVGPCKDRFVAVFARDALDFARHEVQCIVPTDRHETVVAPPAAGRRRAIR